MYEASQLLVKLASLHIDRIEAVFDVLLLFLESQAPLTQLLLFGGTISRQVLLDVQHLVVQKSVELALSCVDDAVEAILGRLNLLLVFDGLRVFAELDVLLKSLHLALKAGHSVA